MSAKLALSVMSEADRQMCLKYNGAAGGGEATALSLYLFTHEILTNMRVRNIPILKMRGHTGKRVWV